MQNNADIADDTSFLSSDALSTPDSLLWEVLPSLHLNIVQTASLCGISVRQLGYWTKQGYVTATGRGARRMYGLDSVRRILAIKRAMTDGASLRQALRGLSDKNDASTAPPLSLSRPAGAALPQTLSLEEEKILAAELLALFAAQGTIRDTAAGLAVKVGRSTEDVQTVAKKLSARGLLSQTAAGGAAVFQQMGTGRP